MRAPTFGSLFAGVGGFDLGLEAAGWQCAFQVEWDNHCQSVLRHHWPTVPKWGDVQEVDGATLPPVDMITFGSPCQDLSVAGKRAGLQGGRSSMFFEATRIIKEMRNATNNVYPRTAIWENVPGALTSNNGADFGAVLDEMAQLGAVAIEWRVLDAQHFGVPQRRRRVFVVAIFDPAIADRCPNPLLPVREGRRGDFTKSRKKGQGTTAPTGRGTNASGKHSGNNEHGLIVDPIIVDPARQPPRIFDGECYTLPARMGTGGNNVPLTTNVATSEVVETLKARSHKGVNTEEAAGGHIIIEATEPIPIADHATRFAGSNGDREGVGKGNGFGVGEPGDPMNTLTQGDRHAVAQPVTVFEPGAIGRLNGDRFSTEVSHTLRANMGDNTPAIVHPITAAFKPMQGEKAFGIGYGEEIAPTLEAGGGGNMPPAIVHPVAQPVTVFQPGQMIRLGGGVSEEIVPTLRAEAKRGDNEPHIAQPVVHAAQPTMAVRRLTPLECERLMGWPDDHTRYTDTGKEQADTHRYKQCGNGVASPVAEWIGRHLHPLHVHHD